MSEMPTSNLITKEEITRRPNAKMPPHGNNGQKDPVMAGFTIANSKPLPFGHVMLQALKIQAERGANMASAY